MPPQPLTGKRERSLEVLAPSAYSVCGAHLPRACLTRYVALSGFLNLRALYFSTAFRPYFMPVTPMGFYPSELYPAPSWYLLSESMPPCRYPHRTEGTAQADFKAFTRHRAVTTCCFIRAQRGNMLSWVSSSPGLSPHLRSVSRRDDPLLSFLPYCSCPVR